MSLDNPRRLLLIHAHPDDETIGTGATMARYAAEGAHVTLVTCTLGELGEVIGSRWAQLTAEQADQLGGYRIGELAAAMSALGVTDHRFLGGAGRFRDSGMIATAGNAAPRAFWQADSDPAVFAAAVSAAVEVIREVRPQVLVTYDPNGGYGHPDHIMAHRVATAAVGAAADPGFSAAGVPWQVAKLYWTAVPRSVLVADVVAVRGSGTSFTVPASIEDLPFGSADAEVTTAIDASAFVSAKADAMRAHATQLSVEGGFYALSNDIGQVLSGVEYFRLAQGDAAGERDAHGRETDLFAGVT